MDLTSPWLCPHIFYAIWVNNSRANMLLSVRICKNRRWTFLPILIYFSKNNNLNVINAHNVAKRELLALTLMCLFESNWQRLVSANKVRTKAIYWTMKLLLSIVWDYKTTLGKGDCIILHVYSVPQRCLIIEWAGAPWPVRYVTPSPAPPKVCGPVQSCKLQAHIRKTRRRSVFTVA